MVFNAVIVDKSSTVVVAEEVAARELSNICWKPLRASPAPAICCNEVGAGRLRPQA